MSNKKVYLAKSSLASGTDVEYVKSHLGRIPGIFIIECGMGTAPRECESLVIVPDATFDPENDGLISANKGLYKIVDNFLEENGSSEVYIYTIREASDHGDIEETTPMCVTLDDLEVEDEDSFNHYGTLYLGDLEDQCSLLEIVSTDIRAAYNDFKLIPRHHQPAPEYAIPPIPSVEERKLKQVSSQYDKLGASPAGYWIKRRPLLRRRK